MKERVPEDVPSLSPPVDFRGLAGASAVIRTTGQAEEWILQSGKAKRETKARKLPDNTQHADNTLTTRSSDLHLYCPTGERINSNRGL